MHKNSPKQQLAEVSPAQKKRINTNRIGILWKKMPVEKQFKDLLLVRFVSRQSQKYGQPDCLDSALGIARIHARRIFFDHQNDHVK